MIKESADASLFGFEEEQVDLTKTEDKDDKSKDTKSEDKETISLTGDNNEFEKNLLAETKEDDDEETDTDDKEDKEDKETKEKSEDTEKDKKTEKEVKEPEENQETNYSFKGIASYLDEEGVIDFEDSKDLEDNPELLVNLVQAKIDQQVTSYKESLPDVVAELVEYIEKGGDPEKFLKAVNKDIDLESLDLEDESNQELLVKEYLKSLDHTKEEIDELIADYKEALILDKQAKFASKKLEKIQESKKAKLIEEQEAIAQEQVKKVEEYKSSVKELITGATELGGLPISKKEKEDFAKYLLEVNPKTGMTKYQEAISSNPKQTQVELAYLKYKEFDFSKVVAKAKTEVTKDIREKIFTKTESTPKGKTKISETEANFEAFKSRFGRV